MSVYWDMTLRLLPLLFAIVLAACSDPALVQPIDKQSGNPTIDTLLTDERTSLTLPPNADPQALKLFVGPLRLPIDLTLDGRMYFKAPSTATKGVVRLYEHDSLIEFDVKEMVIQERTGDWKDVQFYLSPDSIYPGESLVIQAENVAEDANFEIYIGNELVAIDSISNLTYWTPPSILFHYPENATSPKIVIKHDSAAYAIEDVTVLPHTADFLHGKSAQWVDISAQGILGVSTIYIYYDSLRVMPQPTVSFQYHSRNLLEPLVWRGDSIVGSSFRTSSSSTEQLDVRLYAHPGKSAISGSLHYRTTKENDTVDATLHLERMHWVRRGDLYELHAMSQGVKVSVPAIEYRFDFGPGEEILEQYDGGNKYTSISITFRESD
jgi:hypothetical protein